jgi:hypothetical protein
MKATRSTAVALLLGGLMASSTVGCGPIEAMAVINDAEVALSGARAARGYDFAPYEYTTAELYLEKAREERGFAHFGVAIRYARKAAQSAREAQTQSLQRVREGREADPPPEPRRP